MGRDEIKTNKLSSIRDHYGLIGTQLQGAHRELFMKLVNESQTKRRKTGYLLSVLISILIGLFVWIITGESPRLLGEIVVYMIALGLIFIHFLMKNPGSAAFADGWRGLLTHFDDNDNRSGDLMRNILRFLRTEYPTKRHYAWELNVELEGQKYQYESISKMILPEIQLHHNILISKFQKEGIKYYFAILQTLLLIVAANGSKLIQIPPQLISLLIFIVTFILIIGIVYTQKTKIDVIDEFLKHYLSEIPDSKTKKLEMTMQTLHNLPI